MNLLDQHSSCPFSATDDDPLEALARHGARLLLEAALEAEITDYLQRQPHQRRAPDGAFRGYRNGTTKERTLTVGSGTIKVKAPRVSHTPEGQAPFASHILKPYQRCSQTLNAVFPKLFIEGLATRDFEPALRCLLGQEAALSPSTISRLNAKFKGEYDDWLHKVRNILDKLPPRSRGEAAQQLRAIYLSASRQEARQKVTALARSWRGLYDKAAECLVDDLERLLTFFDDPQAHWRHLRTTNPIESVFAAVRLRTKAMKQLRSGRSAVHLLYQLLKRQERKWQRLNHPEKMKEVNLPAPLLAP